MIKINDAIRKEAFKLYSKTWVKNEHNSFAPDQFIFDNVLGIHITMPFMEKAEQSLMIKHRTEKLKQIKNKLSCHSN